jgi:hypothetical protein
MAPGVRYQHKATHAGQHEGGGRACARLPPDSKIASGMVAGWWLIGLRSVESAQNKIGGLVTGNSVRPIRPHRERGNLVVLLIALVPGFASGAPGCAPPTDALAKLKAYLSYESGVGFGRPGAKRFSFAAADGDALFLQHEVPQYYDETQRFIYFFRKGSPLLVAGCPANAQWMRCAERAFRDSIHEPANTPEPPAGPTCELSVTVPEWRPSPDSPFKRGNSGFVVGP